MKNLIYNLRELFKPLYPVEFKTYEISWLYAMHDKLYSLSSPASIQAIDRLLQVQSNRVGSVGSVVVWLSQTNIEALQKLMTDYENDVPMTGFAFDGIRERLTVALIEKPKSVYAE